MILLSPLKLLPFLCKNSFLFTELDIAINLPSILHFLLHEDGKDSRNVLQ